MGNASFEGNSTSKFCNNFSGYGGAINLEESSIHFDQNSTVEFSNNIATGDGGAIFSHESYIYFVKNSAIIFNNNIAELAGGAISLAESSIYCERNSFTQFNNNTAIKCGAIVLWLSNISFMQKSTTEFRNNNAIFGDHSMLHNGGAICAVKDSHITFGDNSSTIFYSNNADDHGGAVFTEDNSVIRFSDISTVIFTENKAKYGAIMYSSDSCKLMVTGDSGVIINDLPAKWCTNASMLYADQSNDVILIDSNGIVWCSIKEAFTCLSKKCHCNSLEDILLTNRSNASITDIAEAVLLSSIISLNNHKAISIIGHNKLTVLCVNGGRLSLKHCYHLTIQGITWIGCGDLPTHQPVLSIYESIDVTIKNCSFQNSKGGAIKIDNAIKSVNISDCHFMNNDHYKDHGGAIKYTTESPPWTKCPFRGGSRIF